MAVREPLGMRKTMLAGAVALALTGTGVALAWAADPPSPTPSQPAPSQSAPGNSGTAPGHNKADKAQRVLGAGVLTELRRREFYEKPTQERKRKKAAAVKRHMKRVSRDGSSRGARSARAY